MIEKNSSLKEEDRLFSSLG